MILTVGEALWVCRKVDGLKQDDLAARWGVSRRMVSHWERGARKPDARVRDYLARKRPAPRPVFWSNALQEWVMAEGPWFKAARERILRKREGLTQGEWYPVSRRTATKREAVPEGYVLVPVEPTQEMLFKGGAK